MSKKQKGRRPKKKPRNPGHTALGKHSRRGTALVPPMAELPLQEVSWERDLLPEHLIIACLAERFGMDAFHAPFSLLVDALDEVWPSDDDVAWGLVSDFGTVPEDMRARFLESNSRLLEDVLLEAASGVLALYPDSPASWVLPPDLRTNAVDLEELGRLRRLVKELLKGKDPFAARVRMMPFSRIIKHGKIRFMRGLEIAELLPKYPLNCTEEEQRKTEALVRAATNSMIPQRRSLSATSWPRDFWTRNRQLTDCKPAFMVVRSGKLLTESHAEELKTVVLANTEAAEKHLSTVAKRAIPDIYNPQRDEVLLGLFARITRLYVAIAGNPSLWSRDLGSIICRCLADTVITFCYLAMRGTEDDFTAFIRYGEGQEKLLMLHLQESYPDESSADGMDAEMISRRLGPFAAETLSIELGHWSKKDTRKLAKEIGMEKIHRLVFSPMSGDVHGTWASIKAANLAYCTEPLHRFHRLPAVTEPPMFISFVGLATELYAKSVEVACESLGYPEMKIPVTAIPFFAEENEEDYPTADSS